MRTPHLLALGTAAAALAAAPLLADAHSVPLTAEELLAPYYDKLAQSVELPVAPAGATLAGDAMITRLAFGSCNHQLRPQGFWSLIAQTDPDLFLFIGDNVYVDIPEPPEDAEDFERTYATLEAQTGWRALRSEVPVLATWDDHDYGLNDAGVEYPLKEIAQQQFITFFDLPEDSAVRQREGVYDAHLFGPEGRRVQVILLDTRYFRDAITPNPDGRVNGLGPYIPRTDGQGSLLGDTQWAWLEQQLEQPADLRIIASSIQVVADEHGWETWGNLPHERDRLYDLIAQTGANGVVFISGDRHLTEVSCEHGPGTPYPIFDFTSSGMNEGDQDIDEPNTHRVGEVFRTANFGLIQIAWHADEPSILYQSRGREGEVILEQAVPLSELSPAAQQ